MIEVPFTGAGLATVCRDQTARAGSVENGARIRPLVLLAVSGFTSQIGCSADRMCSVLISATGSARNVLA